MTLTNYQIISLIVLGVLLGELLFQALLVYLSERKNLHAVFCVTFLALGFVVGYNPHYGMLHSWWPTDYDTETMKCLHFFAVNVFVLSLNFIFAVLPKFRQVNRRIMYVLCAIIMVTSIIFGLVPEEFRYIIVAVISGVHLVYLSYVTFYMVKSINKSLPDTFTIPILFMLYAVFLVWTAIHALQNRQEIYTHFLVGALFPTSLSFVSSFRKFMSYAKVRNNKPAIVPEVAKRMEELEIANTSKDKFFAIIAHDLKSPISSIKTLSEIYIDEASTSRDPHSTELATALRDSIDSLCQLLDDLLSWSRSQLGAMKFLPSYIDIETLVDSVKRVVQPVCAAKNISLKMTINERDKLYGDPNMLQTILRNLITNAVKYSYSESYISLDFDAEGYYSVIKVTDNGIGMKKDELDALFQLDKLNTRLGTNRESGNGLGLIVCQEFVKKHGGTITVETEEALGTTFVVKIPFARYINKMHNA